LESGKGNKRELLAWAGYHMALKLAKALGANVTLFTAVLQESAEQTYRPGAYNSTGGKHKLMCSNLTL